MAIELPGGLAKVLNLVGLARPMGWTNFNEDTARDQGSQRVAHGTTMQAASAELITQAQRFTSTGSGQASDAATATLNHPQGAAQNLSTGATGHKVFGTLVHQTGNVVETGKIYQLSDLSVTGFQLAAESAAFLAGGEFAMPATLAEGKMAQTAVLNGVNTTIGGGGGGATPPPASPPGGTPPAAPPPNGQQQGQGPTISV